jgi:hypothetical protein
MALAAIPSAAVLSTGLLASRKASAQTTVTRMMKQPAAIGYVRQTTVRDARRCEADGVLRQEFETGDE